MNEELVPAPPLGLTKRKSMGAWLVPVALVVLAVYVAFALMQRRQAQTELSAWTRDRAVPYVSVIQPHSDSHPQLLALPGAIAAYYDAAVRSQVAGYIKSWSKDIGAVVKKGDVLAEVATPELDERLAQAREELRRTQAALGLAKVTAERWAALRNSSAVSKQSSDEKASDEKVKEAEVGAASANLDRLKAQKAFAQIVAPFDGVVTARNVDVGAFVSPERSAEPLFQVADVHAVRIYVNVPQIYSARIEKGMKAHFTTPQWPGRTFEAPVTTTSSAIAAATGSLLVELDLANPDGALLPGSYADVRFELPVDPTQLRIPASALSIGGQGTRVAIVDSDDRVRFKQVVIAADFGSEVAIASGPTAKDRVIDNPADTLADGDRVRIGGAAATETKE